MRDGASRVRFMRERVLASRSCSRWILVLLAGMLLVGCRKQYEIPSVDGVVRLDGKPLPDAVVRFIPQQGRASVGKTKADGGYSLQYTGKQRGAEPGRHTVVITSEISPIGGEGNAVPVGGRKELLPARYHTKTGLTADVKSGANTIDFDLTSTP